MLSLAGQPVRTPTVLAEDGWRARADAHAARVDLLTEGHRARRARGEKHPVEDFLFSYYSLSVGRLRRWHPGPGVVLTGASARERLTWRWYAEVKALDDEGRPVVGVTVDGAAYERDRADLVRLVRSLLGAVATRPAQLGCLGLHEWAMVYKEDAASVRHDAWPLRLGPAGTDAVVEGHPVRCTHFDAYRFFTPDALGRNAFQLTREAQVDRDQPGCLHVGMDLYKWAGKLGPLVPGDLLLDCFELARDIRTLDMRASPYDLLALGYEPVKVEAPEGKAEYVADQRAFSERAAPLRAQLLAIVRPEVP